MSVSTLMRLNTSIYLCNNHARERNLYDWFHELLVLYRELSTELDKKKKQDKEAEDMIGQMEKLTNSWMKGDKTKTQALYRELSKFEIFLRGVMDDSGLLIKRGVDPAKALFER